MKEHFVDELPKCTDVAELVGKLDEYETARMSIKRNPEMKGVITEERRRFPQNNTYRKVGELNNAPPFNRYERNQVIFKNEARNGQGQFKVKCYNCNEYASHKANQCPRKKEGILCFKCGLSGHKSFQCNKDTFKNINTTNSREYPSKKIMKHVEIKNKIFNSVVDSASDVTMVSGRIYRELGQPLLNENKVKFTGIGGDEVNPLGSFQTDILIDNVRINNKIFVLDNLQYDMILGNNFLNQINYEISEKGFRITGKRDEERAYEVNLITMIPLNGTSDFTNDPIVSSTLRSEKTNIHMTDELLSDDFKPESIYLAEVADSINVHEIETSHITDHEIKAQLIELINNYKPNKIKDTNLKVNIILTDDIPVAQRPRRLAFPEQEFVDKQVQEWLEAGIITESISNYASPIVLAKKKNNSWRLCVDYRPLNKKIIKDNFPLPLIEEMIDNIEQSQVFSTLDLKNGFFHIDMAEDSKKLTSFVTHNSQFEYVKLPFGLSIGPQHFQRYIQAVFKQLIKERIILVYMDDIIILAQTDEEAIARLKRVLEVAADYGLEFNFKKCQFLSRRIEFLGYVIENGTIRPSEAKTLAVKRFPEPSNIKQLHSFLGLTSYFRKYIPNYAKIAKPLSDLLKAENTFKFELVEREAFETLKEKLVNTPVLHIFNRGAKLELHTDASSLGFGSVLLQEDGNKNLHPIHYMSRKTTPTQAKYTSYELETLAVIESLKKFRNYLLGTKFKIVTDCSAFQKTLDKKDLSPKVARWALFMQEFDYIIIHRAGKQMKHVDALSRNTVLVITRSQDELTVQIKLAQQEDENIQTIKKLIEKNESQEYFIRNELLYKYENDRELLMIPINMQKEIIRDIHNKGHYAVAKTEIIIKENYFIPQLKKQIESVIANCVECILCNRKRGKREGMLNPIPKQNIPLETYHVDHLGPMPSTHKKYNHIFAVVDAFTKFVWLYPVKSTSTIEVIDKLKLQHNTFGNPSRIISDRGSAFTSNEFKTYCQNENIEHLTITTGIPRSNGQIERMLETLIPILAKLTIDDPTKWYKHVFSVQRTINSTISRSIKYTPFELLTGVKLRHKTDLKIKELLDDEHVNTIITERENNRDIAKENILKIQDENRKTFNKRRKKAHNYKLHDMVAIQRTQFGAGLKLKPKFFGPYEIIKVKGKNRYNVKKIGHHEGPNTTSSAADFMKLWTAV